LLDFRDVAKGFNCQLISPTGGEPKTGRNLGQNQKSGTAKVRKDSWPC